MSSGTASIGPEEVRRLRGSLSRALFAAQVGVTPNTVYRWELPDGAKDARRPRGVELGRLEQLRNGGTLSAHIEPITASTGPAPVGAPRPQSSQGTALAGEDVAEVLGAIDRLFRADWQTARGDLLRIVTHARAASLDARALAASGLALVDVLLRFDPRSALGTLSPALHDAEEGRLSAVAAAYVFATAAGAHSLPDATLFDPGRVFAYGARAEEIAHGSSSEISFIAWMPTAHTSVALNDDELLARAFARLDHVSWTDLPPLLALHELELRSLRAMLSGQRALAGKMMEELIAAAAMKGYGVIEARALAMMAVRKLEELADPEQVLALARRSRQVARAAAGPHTVFAARAEAEALARTGRAHEALAAIDDLASYTAETGLPPLLAVTAIARVCFITGQYDRMLQLAESLQACQVPSLRLVCRANASFVLAMHLSGTSEDPEDVVETFERAATEAKGWAFLLRDVLVFGATAHILVGNEPKARLALRRAQRMLDRLPSSWASAHLRRVEGILVARHGSWNQARQLLEAAVGTYESTGDLADAALAKHMIAVLSDAFSEPNGRVLVEESNARLASLGLRPPRTFRAGVARAVAARRAESSANGSAFEGLVAPLQRLAVRGADPGLVQRELVSITSELIGMRATRLEEVDSTGETRLLGGTVQAGSSSFEWAEFGDGIGRRLRLGALGPLGDHERAVLSVLGTVGGLALEVATLRNMGAARIEGGTGEDDAGVPGLIAASPAMRALRSEIARLAGSRATVVVQGESGTGKEVVARAIHDLSIRAAKPYVTFNCAAIPRDLFEGQLFGYRRGAFTGATQDHPGVLRAAEGGTIFLDEIGELPLDVQPKLLRFLENGEVFPLGDKRPQVVDVRVIAATHRDLAALARERRFREDLYYRLQVIVLRIAPLRDRREDIAPLARHFLRQLGSPAPILTSDALAKLAAYDWPGNVRELRNVLERALAYSPPPKVIHPEQLKLTAG